MFLTKPSASAAFTVNESDREVWRWSAERIFLWLGMVRGNVRSSPGCHQRRTKLSWRKSPQIAGGKKELERNGWKVKGGILVESRVELAWEGWRTTSIFSRWALCTSLANMRHTSCSPLFMLAHWFRRKIHFHHLLQQMLFTNLIQTMSWDKLDPNNISRQTAGGSGHCWCSHHRRQHQPPPKHHPYNEKWASILWSRWCWLAIMVWETSLLTSLSTSNSLWTMSITPVLSRWCWLATLAWERLAWCEGSLRW